MSSTTFVPRQTLITADWLNDVDAQVYENWISSLNYSSSSAAALAAAGFTSETNGFLQFTKPIRYNDSSTYVDRKALITLRRSVLSPTGIIPSIHSIATGKGDNTTFIGVSGAYFQSRDDTSVTSLNKGVLYGAQFSVVPRVERNNIPFDDVAGIIIQNDSDVAGSKGTDALYIGRNSSTFPTAQDREWLTGVTMAANASYQFRAIGAYFTGYDLVGKMDGVGGNTFGYKATGEIQSSATTEAALFTTTPTTQATAFTLTDLHHYIARQGSLGAGSAITNQYGFRVASTLTGATNNYGFYSGIGNSSGRWNFYAAGTAPNFMAGQLLLGSSTVAPSTGSNPGLGTPYLQIQAAGSVQAWLGRYSNDTGGAASQWLKSRGTSVGSHGVVVSGDTIATLGFYGSDGTNFIGAASIVATVDGTPGTNDMPGALEIKTTPDGSTTPVSRIKVNNQGDVILNNKGSALGTTATAGFTYLPSCAGAPTGVPATLPTGAIPVVVDSTNNKLYFYSGGAWRDAGP